MHFDGLKFVMVGTSDIDRSIEFYRDRLELPLTSRFEDFAFFDCKTATLVVTGQLAPANATDSETNSELVFAVPSVDAEYAALSNRGVAFVNTPRQVNAQAWAVNFRDPDGHLLSLYGSP